MFINKAMWMINILEIFYKANCANQMRRSRKLQVVSNYKDVDTTLREQ